MVTVVYVTGVCVTILKSVWVGGVVEYLSVSGYWWCYHTEASVGRWCSGVLVSVWVLVVLPY